MGLLCFLVTAIFGTAGTVIGALGGLLSSMIDGTGMMHGILIGANNGALFSLEFADSVLRLCCCADYFVEEQNPRRRLSLAADIIGSALDSQADALQRHSDRELHRADLFQRSYEVLAARKATLPMTELTKETAEHHNTCCIICLSELQAGEFARSLPACCHVFHLACIDSWFRRKSECPICRHPVY